MKKVYIAGPYAADTQTEKRANIERARAAAAALYRKGWAPFIPHTMTADFELYYPDIKRQTYLDTDLQWLESCDALLLLEGWENSHGSTMELCHASRLGIPVYKGIEELPDATTAGRCEEADTINHPPHYTQAKMECIEAIEGLGLPFHEAQVLKYIVRWRHKGGYAQGIEDLLKGLWYLKRLIGLAQGGENNVGISGEPHS